MALGDGAFREYLVAQGNLRDLIASVKLTQTDRANDELRRACTVLVCAALEGFLGRLGEEHLDATLDPYDTMTGAQKVAVAATAVGTFAELNRALDVIDVGAADRVARTIRRVNEWLEVPGAYAKSGAEPTLGGFWEPDAAPKVLERLLVQLRSDGERFFSWMGRNGIDDGALWVTLQQLVRLRNDVAHGDRLLPSPSLDELRTYRSRVHLIVRRIRIYCTEP